MKSEIGNICIPSSYITANKIRMKLLLLIDKELLSNNKNLCTKLNVLENTIEFSESFSYTSRDNYSFSKKSTIENTPNIKEYRLNSHKKTDPKIKSNSCSLNLAGGFKKCNTYKDKARKIYDIIYLNGKSYSIKKFNRYCSCVPIHNEKIKDQRYLKKLCDSLKIPHKKKERRISCELSNFDNCYPKYLIKGVNVKKRGDKTWKHGDTIKKYKKDSFSLKKNIKNQNCE